MAGTADSVIVEQRAHDRFLAHHFQTYEQQFDAGKLGMWIFLVTEVLFFSALFVAYAVYRSNHPEVFVYARQFLHPMLGGLNTVVLLCSSLTMAWAVRCAQLDQQRGLVLCLGLTLGLAGFFLGVKSFEYSTKWNEGLLWAGSFQPHDSPQGVLSAALITLCVPAAITLVVAGTIWVCGHFRGAGRGATLWLVTTLAAAAWLGGAAVALALTSLSAEAVHTQHVLAHPGTDPTHGDGETAGLTSRPPHLAGVFFSIYYAMTGLHAMHILAGMAVIGWLLRRAIRGDFGARYYGPVDYVGLYWHLVDLVWIYLFPLLYLIN